MHELHAGSGQFHGIAVVQLHHFFADGRAIDQGAHRTLDMRQHKTMRAPGNGSHGHARLADGGDHLDEVYFAPGRGP